jgi:hypothetical protein
VDAALVVEIDVPGGVAGLAAPNAGIKVKPLPGVTTRHLQKNLISFTIICDIPQLNLFHLNYYKKLCFIIKTCYYDNIIPQRVLAG